MRPKYYYGSITEGLEFFQKQGYNLDFNLEESGIAGNELQVRADEFTVVGIFRYEGDSNPADESMVLAIESKNGLKGTLVMGYGRQQNDFITAILATLK